MKSICFFSSYFNQDTVPYYIRYYIEELRNYFSEFVFVTNEKALSDKDLSYLNSHNIDLLLVANEGFDFGMWYKAMKKYDITTYDRVGFVNDSAVLFKPLTETFRWIDASGLDYAGLVSSRRITFHVQSYFIIINKNAIKPVYDYFMANGIIEEYQKVIQIYEVGLSDYLRKLNLKVGAQYYSKRNIEQHNPSFLIIDELIKEGLPVIKKKIIFRSYRRGEYVSLLRMSFNVDQRYYINLIKSVNNREGLIDFDKVLNDFPPQNNFDIYVYRIVLFFYKIASKSKFLTFLFHQLILLRRRLRGDKNKQILITSEPEVE